MHSGSKRCNLVKWCGDMPYGLLKSEFKCLTAVTSRGKMGAACKNTIPTLRYSDEGLMLFGCFATEGIGEKKERKL